MYHIIVIEMLSSENYLLFFQDWSVSHLSVEWFIREEGGFHRQSTGQFSIILCFNEMEDLTGSKLASELFWKFMRIFWEILKINFYFLEFFYFFFIFWEFVED